MTAPTLTLICGDALAELKKLAANSCHCAITSPPYWGLRDYKVPGQIGLEPTPDEWCSKLVAVFREVRRVLHPSGTCWINCGDAYAANRGYQVPDSKWCDVGNEAPSKVPSGLKPKDLIGLPWLLAFALRADGWYLRSEIIWCKRAPMPESVSDRPTTATEKIFLLSKSASYFYDQEAVRQPYSEATLPEIGEDYRGQSLPGCEETGAQNASDTKRRIIASLERNGGSNLRNFWLLSPEPFPDAHFATFPSEIPRRCILAATSARGVCPKCGAPWERVMEKTPEYAAITGKSVHDHDGDGIEYGMRQDGKGPLSGDATKAACPNGLYRTLGWQASCACNAGPTIPATVLDPFLGSGTSAAVALELGRSAIGIELSPSYIALAHRRCASTTPGLALA